MPDVCARRHRGNAESQEANRRTNKSEGRNKLYAWFVQQGDAGGTCYEASVALGMGYTTCSARISELKAEGQLVPSGARRMTPTGSPAAVLKAVKPKPQSAQQNLGF